MKTRHCQVNCGSRRVVCLAAGLALAGFMAAPAHAFENCFMTLTNASGVIGQKHHHEFKGSCSEVVSHPAQKEFGLGGSWNASFGTTGNVSKVLSVSGKGEASWDRKTGQATEEFRLTGSVKMSRMTTAVCTNDPFLDNPPGGAVYCSNYQVMVKVDSGPMYEFYGAHKFLARRGSPLQLAIGLSADSKAGAVPPPPPPPKPQTQPPAGNKVMSSPKKAGTVNFEAEALLVQNRTHVQGGQVSAQAMQGFGPTWSGNAQLFWHGGAPGAVLDLDVDVPAGGSYQVVVLLTRAPDYGTLRFQVDGADAGVLFNGYSAAVTGPASQTVGTFSLQQGMHRISIMITGKNDASSGFLVGVDRVALRPM